MSRDTEEIDKKGQPMTQSKLGITGGRWKAVVPKTEHFHDNGQDITTCGVYSMDEFHDADRVDKKAIVSHQFTYRIGLDEARANMELIAEAGTVCNRTGLTPAELERERDEYKRQRDELRELFFTYSGHDDGCDIDPDYVKCTCGYSEVYARLTATNAKPLPRHPARRRR